MILGIIWTLFLGGLAGWIAGKLMGSEGSMLRNVILGLVGGAVGSFVLGLIRNPRTRTDRRNDRVSCRSFYPDLARKEILNVTGHYYAHR